MKILITITGVVENGGVVNKIGTYALGIVARELGKPLYVAAESYKFARLFPLNQRDLPDRAMAGGSNLAFTDTTTYYDSPDSGFQSEEEKPRYMTARQIKDTASSRNSVAVVSLPDQLKVENPSCDYTPAKYISLLFTDLGVLTPSAVSDELIRLYQ
jgi:translation initiation factor eIF-2B subunit alpha